MAKQYRLVEEVPGVPLSERFYAAEGFAPPIQYFSSLKEARSWFHEMGIEDYTTEFFEP